MSAKGPFNDCDIVKRGYVHIKRPPSSVKLRLKAWQKRYFVLVDATVENGGRAQLEIHDCEGDWRESRRRQSGTYVVDLRSVTSVEEYRESRRFSNAFIVARSGQCPFVLGANTDLEMKEWVAAIKMLSEKTRPALATRGSVDGRCINVRGGSPCLGGSPYLARCGRLCTPSPDPRKRLQAGGLANRSPRPPPVYARRESRESQGGYAVLVEPTEDSARNGLSGEYVMNIRGADVVLRKVGQQMAYIQWPIAHIRKFKSEEMTGDDLVTLDASVQCGSKVGMYLFRTRYGSEIVKEVSDAVKMGLSRQRTATDLEAEMDRLRIQKQVDPYLDLLRVDSDTSDEMEVAVSTSSPNGSPPPIAQRQRQQQTQQHKTQQQEQTQQTQQTPQPERTRQNQHLDSENSSADSAVFMNECSSDRASHSGAEDGRRGATPAGEDMDESDDDFPPLSPPPPPPRQRNPLLHHSLPLSARPVPPPLPDRTSV
ncbi:hypothetical protein LSAT2_000866 [Lamellibrachia satsuma]|nr:hypothetical protein LSAT2_000866 [Lamellibrachia satsuma]